MEIAQSLERAFSRGGRIARAFTEARVTFGGASVVPDVSLLRWDRIPRAASGRLRESCYCAARPKGRDLVCRSVDSGLTARCEWHVQHRVQIALLVHHCLETIQVMRADLPTTVHRAGERFALDALGPGQEFARGETLEELFDEGREAFRLHLKTLVEDGQVVDERAMIATVSVA